MFGFLLNMMKIQTQQKPVHTVNNISFKGLGTVASSEVQNNAMLNRSLIDMFGVCVPWAIMANNKDEKREKIIRFSIGFAIPFLTPFVILPILNKSAMKYIAKITTKFNSNDYKAIWLSNKFLKNSSDTSTGLKDLALKYHLNEKEVLKFCNNSYETLRKKLIKSKNAVMLCDLLFTSVVWANAQWISNQATKFLTGKKGSSAEYSMANKELVEKRAETHEKNKKKKWLGVMGLCTAMSIVTAGLVNKSLLTKKTGGFLKYVQDKAVNFDYKKGVYMPKFPLFLVAFFGAGLGTLSAARNKTELKDLSIRVGSLDALYFTGDLAIASILSRLCDKTFKTDLMKKEYSKNNLWNKIFPPAQKIDEITNIKSKKYALGIYWASMLSLMGLLGFAVPAITNKLTRKDIEQDLAKQSLNNIHNLSDLISPKSREIFKEFVKS